MNNSSIISDIHKIWFDDGICYFSLESFEIFKIKKNYLEEYKNIAFCVLTDNEMQDLKIWLVQVN